MSVEENLAGDSGAQIESSEGPSSVRPEEAHLSQDWIFESDLRLPVKEVHAFEYTEAEIEILTNKIKRCVTLFDLTDADWTEDVLQVIRSYFQTDVKVLTVYFNNTRLEACLGIPTCPVHDLIYFTRESDNNEPITEENFDRVMCFGTTGMNVEGSLLSLVENVYAPFFFNTTAWPDSVKSDFCSDIHTFLGNLTDLSHKLLGLTLMYVPKEGLNVAVDQAVKDKELIKRLEGVVVNWMKQLRVTLGDKYQSTVRQLLCPKDEYKFWIYRYEHLRGLEHQLANKDLQNICHILAATQSAYLKNFNRIQEELTENLKEAESNVGYLDLLVEPCAELEQVISVAQIPEKIPQILNLMRVIWNNSPYYNTTERVTVLCRAISNQIILQCINSVNLDDILTEGKTRTGTNILQRCINCCQHYKVLYDKLADSHTSNSDKPWDLDKPTIFNHVDSFVQRCADMIDVCEAMIVFGRIDETEVVLKPMFSGTRGLEFEKVCTKLEETFHDALGDIKRVRRTILDVQEASWYDSIFRFRKKMRDIEVIIENLVASLFESIVNVEEGIDALWATYHYSSRKNLVEMFQKRTMQVYSWFASEIQEVKNSLVQNYETYHSFLPYYGGRALLAKMKMNALRQTMEKIDAAVWMLPCALNAEVRSQFQSLSSSVDEYVVGLHRKWFKNLPDDCLKSLHCPLMIHSQSSTGLLEPNFDRCLRDIVRETAPFLHLGLAVPPTVQALLHKWPYTSFLYQCVLQVVLDYNKIIAALSDEERLLFKELIKVCDKKINPGLNRLYWDSEVSDLYMSDCVAFTSELQDFIDDYKKCLQQIVILCEKICDSPLISIAQTTAYNITDLDNHLYENRKSVTVDLIMYYNELVDYLVVIHEGFEDHMNEMQNYWARFILKIDHLLEEAFMISYRSSLHVMLDILHGDQRTGPNQLINVNASLTNNMISFSPSLMEVSNLIANIMRNLLDTVKGIPRLWEKFHTKSNCRSFHHVIDGDDECRKCQNGLNTEMKITMTKIRDYISDWEPFEEIWEIDKNAFLVEFEAKNPSVEEFDAGIGKYVKMLGKKEKKKMYTCGYSDLANNVQTMDSMSQVHFLIVNSTTLKQNIMEHCIVWQKKLTDLLMDLTNRNINHVFEYTDEWGEKIMQQPTTLEELQGSTKLLDVLKDEVPVKEQLFPVIRHQMTVLHKYDVEVPKEVRMREAVIDARWEWYLSLLKDGEEMLMVSKDGFQRGLLRDAEELKNRAHEVFTELLYNGPYTSEWTATKALAYIKNMMRQMQEMKDLEARVTADLAIFHITSPESLDLQNLDKELSTLQIVWEITDEWDHAWESYKTGNFWDIKTAAMDNTAQTLYRQLNALTRELKDKNWEIVSHSRNRVDSFRKTLPLITDLKNPAMRDRHWDRVRKVLNRQFDEKAPDFTLEKIMEMDMQNYAEAISQISLAATMELAIENQLKNVAETWKHLKVELQPFKDKAKGIFTLKSADEIFQTLEEHQVMLSTMKSTKYVEPFYESVDYWERTLSLIMEVLETLFSIQRQWMYLDNIFTGEDIRKQLPGESGTFDQITATWKDIMNLMKNDLNAKVATHHPGMLNKLNGLIERLESIQRALEKYLETKRHVFPRFYFISNEDLLEILANSRKPDMIQSHLKKLFSSILSLKMVKGPIRMEGHGMHSLDGEYIDFGQLIALDGPVEVWLNDVEAVMRVTLRDLLKKCRADLRKNLQKRDKWIKDWPGQLCITSSQIQWTTDCTRTLLHCKAMDTKKPLKKLRKKMNQVLLKFSDAIRSDLTKIERLKVAGLVTIEIHARDVIDQMYKAGCHDVTAFEWLKQLRFYWDREIDDCVVRQTNTRFIYQYEYLGNSERLVITPLTDRCYITLTTALHLHRGGSPKGPAGTGKTETVKDLGKGLGMYVIVINCSEGLDYKSIGKMYSGLAQSGAWGCFDEFNRINIEVLSVVAQQILSVLSALTAKQERFIFNGFDVQIRETCGIFITMNPGYAGRTELPDNLKAMFRPIAMMVPDSAMIAEIMLFGEGFRDTRVLAKKTFTLFFLTKQQLSKQDHYEWGLRGLVTLIRYSGKKRMRNSHLPEEEVLLLSMKDMNLAKLTRDDVPLFLGILSDLFPGVDTPTVDYSQMNKAIYAEFLERKLQVIPVAVLKVIQLFETKNSRHSVVLCGKTGSAKSTTWKVLQGVLTRLSKEGTGNPEYEKVDVFPINPKALNQRELYGEFDLATNEWMDGVISSTMRTCCASTTKDQKWILFDGPVDAVWIENMNSVMDDNKVLTLVNSERITMPPQVTLLFEVEDLSEASPATVSRCGIVYNDYKEFGWKPYVESWLGQHPNKDIAEELRGHFYRVVDPILEFKRMNCVEPVPIAEINSVMTLCHLLSSLATLDNGIDPADETLFANTVKLWFMFCVIWSLCCTVNEEGRKKLDTYIREFEGGFPLKDTIYEFYVDGRAKAYIAWEEKLSDSWKFNPYLPFYKIIVPTVDTIRYEYLVSTLLGAGHSPLLIGPVGTGKTSTAISVLETMDNSKYSLLFVNMSAQTSSPNVQDMIQSRLEKRTKGVYVPVGGKQLITFMDDLNMPVKEVYGAQPPLELIRHWIDYGFWYNRTKQFRMYVQGMLVMAAMGPPGGGRNMISNRLLSRFSAINMTFPSEDQITRIFGTLLNQQLSDFDEELKKIADNITAATIDVYNSVTAKMLPTPAKMHYMFNLRDISKVFQGLLRSHKDYQNTNSSLLRLWLHECFRVFYDRLVDFNDRDWFSSLVNDVLGKHFQLTFHSLCPSKKSPIFCDFCNKGRIYEDMVDIPHLRKFLNNVLEDYNSKPGIVEINLVLFMDAVEHICHIQRVISQPRGNMLLIGVGGSGRQSLTRVAAILTELNMFQIEVTKFYRLQEFREDMKLLYSAAGVENKPTCFIIADSQITDERFVEVINNILSSGEVPTLYKPDEFEEIKTRLEDAAVREKIPLTTEAIYNFMLDRARANLHVVMCLSPIGDAFKDRIRQFPALVNCNTIDWFLEWPREALLEVANKYLLELDFTKTITGEPMKRIVETAEDTKYENPQEKLREAVASICATIHGSVSATSKVMFAEMKRQNYVTPTNFLELVAGYIVMLKDKRIELAKQANKLRSGLSKIDDTRVKVEEMTVELQVAKAQVAEFQQQCDDYLVIIVAQKREADEQSKEVAIKSMKIAEEELACSKLAAIAQADLDEAMPALNEAMQALDALNKKDLTEIKSYPKPPYKVEMVMEAVMILKRVEPSWAEAKRQLGDVDFLNKLRDFDKNNIPDRVLKKIATYTTRDEFEPESVGVVSLAAKSLAMWVIAIEKYAKVYKIVAPKQAKLDEALGSLREKQNMLAAAQAKLQELADTLEKLQLEYDEKQKVKEELRQKAELLMAKLERAAELISGLSDERERWTQTVADLDHQFDLLPGDVLLTTGSLAYLGPFVTHYREYLTDLWEKTIVEEEVPMSNSYSLIGFLTDPTQVREWSMRGLPTDLFSIENGVITNHASRWPLIIDPQCQAWRWIKNSEGPRGLHVLDFGMTGYIKEIELAMAAGEPVLIQNVLETLDPAIRPVLQKSLVQTESGYEIRMGDHKTRYDPLFRLYMTTKLPNPHYSPEISTATTIINFAIKQEGLEGQLLGFVVRKEKPQLEEHKDYLVTTIASGKKKLKEMEDELLRLLNESEGSLLDNEELHTTLQVSKETSIEVKESLAVSEVTEVEIDAAREAYRPCAKRASILFFVLTDLSQIDPMYQFSLESYTQLFNLSIDKSQKSSQLEERIVNLNDYHTYAFYKNTCRALFERHKLLFAFHMCVKILEAQGKMSAAEYNYFLKGGVVLDRSSQTPNPCAWMSPALWDNVTELDKLPGFHGVVASFEQFPKEWSVWFTSQEPENNYLIGEWQDICTEFQRILFVRALRPDRISYCVTSFLINTLGARFVEPPVLDVKAVLEDSVSIMPLIFVLSPGVDPTSTLLALVESSKMTHRFHSLSLGQGQSPIATQMLKHGVVEGDWVFLANCHLSLSWMPHLDKFIESLPSEKVHPRFRLWLSSSPSPEFPISILQASLKMTTEPPKGLKANLKRLYQLVTDETFSACQTQSKYKKLLFSLCFFHAVLLERKKFQQLGWNIIYSFNDSDFEVSESLVSIYLDEYPDTPWDALKYLIAGINYGGHVTDDWDRRLLMTYINQYFTEEALATPYFRLSTMTTYYIPRDGSLQSYRDYIRVLPAVDQPQAFGQHPNADITSLLSESLLLTATLQSLQTGSNSVSSGEDKEEKVLQLAGDIVSKIPDPIDYENTDRLIGKNKTPLDVVLLQEITRYNVLLVKIKASLTALEKAVQGLIVMSPDLEDIFLCLYDGRVPASWLKVYPSMMPLGSWTRDLVLRVSHFSRWATTVRPPVLFWLAAYTFPTGFLTAVLQTAARANKVSIDLLSWEFTTMAQEESSIVEPAAEGVFVRTMYLEGAGWDKKLGCLAEPLPMQLIVNMPVIHFKPVEVLKRRTKGLYNCPCYYFPMRCGAQGRESYVVAVDLKTGQEPPDHWIKRATALLLSLAL